MAMSRRSFSPSRLISTPTALEQSLEEAAQVVRIGSRPPDRSRPDQSRVVSRATSHASETSTEQVVRMYGESVQRSTFYTHEYDSNLTPRSSIADQEREIGLEPNPLRRTPTPFARPSSLEEEGEDLEQIELTNVQMEPRDTTGALPQNSVRARNWVLGRRWRGRICSVLRVSLEAILTVMGVIIMLAVLLAAVGVLPLSVWAVVVLAKNKFNADCKNGYLIALLVSHLSVLLCQVVYLVLRRFFCMSNPSRTVKVMEYCWSLLVCLLPFVYIFLLVSAYDCSSENKVLYVCSLSVAVCDLILVFFFVEDYLEARFCPGLEEDTVIFGRQENVAARQQRTQRRMASVVKVSLPPSAEPEDFQCAICLSEFESSEGGGRTIEEAGVTPVRIPRCGHIFHHTCLEGWFSVKFSCPLCRRNLAVPPPDTLGRRTTL